MVKTKITETTERYDKDGKLVEKITREEIREGEEHKNITPSAYSWFPQTPNLTTATTALLNK